MVLPIIWTTAGIGRRFLVQVFHDVISELRALEAMAARFITAQVELETKPALAFTAIKKMNDYVAFSTAYFALSIATSLFTTFFIALRIILVQRAAYKSTKSRRNPYSAAIEIPVESAVMYSATLLTFVILDVTKNGNAFYAQNIHAQMTVYLIYYECVQWYSRALPIRVWRRCSSCCASLLDIHDRIQLGVPALIPVYIGHPLSLVPLGPFPPFDSERWVLQQIQIMAQGPLIQHTLRLGCTFKSQKSQRSTRPLQPSLILILRRRQYKHTGPFFIYSDIVSVAFS